jgi:prepilin-type N-terminal cleavage/methylation domain-containing protein
MMTRRGATHSEGFSLLELMIATVILGVITSQLFLVLQAQQQAYRGEASSLDVQETTRLVLDLISFDTRNAGMLVPREVSVASVDGGPNGPDRFCVSDGSTFQIPPPGTDNEFWNNLDHTFGGGVADAGAVNGGRSVDLDSLDIEDGLNVTLAGGPTNDFVVGAGIILANGFQDPNGTWMPTGGTRQVHCARIERSAGVRVDFDTATPSSFTGVRITAVPAILYEVVQVDADTTRLLRNSIPISDQIEDLQIQYWADVAPTNGVLDNTPQEWPLDTLDGKDTSRIRRVRIYALGRTELPDDSGGAALARHHHPGLANRVEGTTYDTFKRQVFVASVLPRNLFDYLSTASGAVANVP